MPSDEDQARRTRIAVGAQTDQTIASLDADTLQAAERLLAEVRNLNSMLIDRGASPATAIGFITGAVATHLLAIAR